MYKYRYMYQFCIVVSLMGFIELHENMQEMHGLVLHTHPRLTSLVDFNWRAASSVCFMSIH